LIDRSPSKYTSEWLLSIRAAHIKSTVNEGATITQESPRSADVGRLVQALSIWERERSNSSEEFWQSTLKERPELLGSATNGRPFTLGAQCYVGEKAINNRGGSIVDFLLQCNTDAVLVEIKTPATKLLGPKYRSIYPPSHDLVGTVVQALNYRITLMKELYGLQARSPGFLVRDPTSSC
jgi:hypothetical protein